MKLSDLEKELKFQDARSGGPGGQNVNKVNTKIELRFDILSSTVLTSEHKERLLHRLKGKISKEGILIISSQSERSQLRNKKACIDKFYSLIKAALKKNRKRISTKPTRSSIEKRIKNKKKTGEKKELRRRIN